MWSIAKNMYMNEAEYLRAVKDDEEQEKVEEKELCEGCIDEQRINGAAVT